MIVNIPDAALTWLRHGERGISSEAIFAHLTGVPITRWLHPPADAGDLGRCRKLLAAVPEFAARLSEMASLDSQWARLVEHWDELCALMDEEAPKRRYPRTYQLMHMLLHGRKPPR